MAAGCERTVLVTRPSTDSATMERRDNALAWLRRDQSHLAPMAIGGSNGITHASPVHMWCCIG